MKVEIFAALIRRFKKLDKNIKSLHDNVCEKDESIISINKEINDLILKIPENKDNIYQGQFNDIRSRLDSLTSNQQRILLQELQEPQRGEKGSKGDPGKDGISVTGDPGKDGEDGKDGRDGLGIERIFINAKDHLILIYTDQSRVDLGLIKKEIIKHVGGGGELRDSVKITNNRITSFRDSNGNEVDPLDYSGLFSVNAGNPALFDLNFAGSCEIWTANNVGKYIKNLVNWNIQTGIDSGFPNDNTPIMIDINGDVVFPFFEGASTPSPEDFSNKVMLGQVARVSGNVSQINPGFWSGEDFGLMMYETLLSLGPYMYQGLAGANIGPIATTLNLNITAGRRHALFTGSISNFRLPNLGVEITKQSFGIALIDPGTGAFAFSPTAEIDPTQVVKGNTISNITSTGGGSQSRILSSGHGLSNGDSVTIVGTNPTDYIGTHIISNINSNFYTIDVAFNGYISGGRWSSTSTVTSGMFTGQRGRLFGGTSTVIGIYFGQLEYNSILDYNEALERFREPSITATASNSDTIIVQESATDLGDINMAEFVPPLNRFKQ